MGYFGRSRLVFKKTPVVPRTTLPSLLWISLATFLSQQVVMHIRLQPIQNIIHRMGRTGPPCSKSWAAATPQGLEGEEADEEADHGPLCGENPISREASAVNRRNFAPKF